MLEIVQNPLGHMPPTMIAILGQKRKTDNGIHSVSMVVRFYAKNASLWCAKTVRPKNHPTHSIGVLALGKNF